MKHAALAFRIHRFEAVGLGLLAIGAFAFAGGVWFRLLALALPASCFINGHDLDPSCAARQAGFNEFQDLAGDFAMFAVLAIAILPVALGLVLGVAVVAKELERGTVALAWSIAPSRRRWLLGVVLPGLVVALALSVAAGFLADRLELARDPTIEPSKTLHHLGLRGVVLPAYALASFGIALAVGARLGRVLPALLLAGALSLGAILGTSSIVNTILHTEYVAVDGSAMLEVRAFATGSVFDAQIRTPEGELIPWYLAYQRFGEVVNPESPSYDPAYREAYLVTPGDLYPIAEWRMSVILGAVGLMGTVVAFAIVERRRPT
jgi:ABC-type transport system involved in multi-copper enzyme maturation permease subunit